MSIVYRPPRFSESSTGSATTTTTTTFPTSSRSASSVPRPPLLSIPQVQSTATIPATINSSQSPPTSTSDYSPKFNKPLTPPREKRRKLRSTRAGSPVLLTSLSSNPSSLRSKNKLSSSKPRAHSEVELHSDNDEDCTPLSPLRRLDLKSSIPPLPPAIPHDFMVPPSQCSYAHNTPIIQPSYTTPRDTPHDTYTCVRTISNPFSVSISSQPAVRFSKTTIPKLNRLHRSSVCSAHDSPAGSSLEIKKAEELDKWWHWAKLCKVTGDGNKSSYLTSLPCRDLKRNFDNFNSDHQHDLRIQTRPLSESALEQQKFHYSG